MRLLTHGPNSRKYNFRIWGREDRNWPTIPFASRSRKDYTNHWNGKGLMDVPFDVVMKDNGSIRTFGECLNKMQKPGQGGGTVGSPGCSDICRKNKASSQGKSKAKTKASKGPTRLHE